MFNTKGTPLGCLEGKTSEDTTGLAADSKIVVVKAGAQTAKFAAKADNKRTAAAKEPF